MSELEQAITGRTRKEPVKKGTTSWTPSNLGEVINKEPGFRYRWARNDPDNVAKKHAEGWETVNGTTNSSTTAKFSSSRLDEPSQMTSTPMRRDAVLMRLDDDGVDSTAQQRDRYHNEKVEKLEKRIYAGTKKELVSDSGAPIHGNLTKERKGVRTVIE